MPNFTYNFLAIYNDIEMQKSTPTLSGTHKISLSERNLAQ